MPPTGRHSPVQVSEIRQTGGSFTEPVVRLVMPRFGFIVIDFRVVLQRHWLVGLWFGFRVGQGGRARVWSLVCDGGAGEVVLGTRQAGGEGGAVLSAAAARIVLVQVVGQSVPATTNTNHHVRAKNLEEVIIN